MRKRFLVAAAALAAGAFIAVDRSAVVVAQGGESLKAAPNRRADEGKGPFKTLVIRGVTLIDGTGAPPQGADALRQRGGARARRHWPSDAVAARREHAPRSYARYARCRGEYWPK